MLNGIDVSAYQGTIDFGLVKQGCKVDFVFAKASEGLYEKDACFDRNHDMCKVHGIPFGAYHFFRFNFDANAQAEHFLQAIDGRVGTLLPFVDVEVASGFMGLEAQIETLGTFNARVEAAIGKKIIIYTGLSFWNSAMQGSDAFSGHPLFVAEYNNDPAPTLPNGWSDWVLWQYTSGLVIPGIPAFVDGDRYNGTDLGAITL